MLEFGEIRLQGGVRAFPATFSMERRSSSCASMPITTAIDLPGNQLTSLTMIPLQILRATKSKLVARGIKVIDAMPIYLFVNRERFIRAWKEIRWRRFWREC